MLAILAHLLNRPEERQYGLAIAAATGLGNGSMYPALDRLEDAGHVKATWETHDEKEFGRRRRCYYELTPSGIEYAKIELSKAPTLPGRFAGEFA